MCAPDMPEPPDPYVTADAQTKTNIDTAIANNRMGMVDQITPFGSLTYETIYDSPQGSGAFSTAAPAPTAAPAQPQYSLGANASPVASTALARGPGDPLFDSLVARGEIVSSGGGAASVPAASGAPASSAPEVPRYRATVKLSDDQQRILDSSNDAKINLSDLAAERAGFLRDYLPNATPEAIEGKLYEYGASRLDPRFAREEEALRTRLANQGLTPGSAAWNAEMERLGQNKNDAYNSLMLSGRSTALSEINNPINQITALLSGSQITNPGVSMATPAQTPTVDMAGLINNNYNARANNARAEAEARNNLLGGLFKFATAPINPTSLLGGAFA